MLSFDHTLSAYLTQNFALLPYIADIARACAEYMEWGIVIGLLLYGVHTRRAMWARVQVVGYAVGVAAFVRLGIKPLLVYALPLARPYVAFNDVVLLASPQVGEEMQSFPSGHALFFFALATVLYMYNKKVGTVLYVCAALMALARVCTGLHYASDVAAGAAIGSVVAYICVRCGRIYISKFFNVR